MKWSKKYDACIVCERRSLRHQARGLCVSCYSNVRYSDPVQRQKHREIMMKKYNSLTPDQKLLRVKRAKKVRHLPKTYIV